MNRRQFLQCGLGLGAITGSMLLPVGIIPQAQASVKPMNIDITRGARQLYLERPATDEQLNLVYLVDGQWAPDAYSRLCWLMRDTRANEITQMDPKLIAILDWIQDYLADYGYTQPIQITSGYRSPKTNAATEGAAKNSQHVLGKALDIHIPGLPTSYLGELLKWLSQGGVGVYQGKNFVHLDTGSVRSWTG